MNIDSLYSARLSYRKARDKAAANLISTLISEVENELRTKQVDIASKVRKYISVANESAQIEKSRGNLDSYVNYIREVEILTDLLPPQLTEGDLRNIIGCGFANIGEVMKHLNEYYAGRFDRGLAANIAKELL